ncbi:M24 family metallopeptidase [Egibacter rhizosphaerae]|nr:Xaa-Pro peptidase family protein [Egibacter rhizosphaerae]
MDEYETRLENVRREMHAQALDGLLVMGPEDLYYLTGYRSMGYFAHQVLIVRPSGEPLMLSRVLEQRMYLANSWSQRYHAYGDDENPIEATIEALRGEGLGAGNRLGVPLGSKHLSPVDAVKLQDAMPGAEWVDATGLVARLRSTKSDREIEYIRQAASFTRTAFRAAAEAAAEGKTENDLAAAFLGSMIAEGSEKPASGPLVGSGPRSSYGHSSWEGRPLERGDLIFLEGGGCVRRYHAGAMRTIAIGEPSEQARALEEGSRAAATAAVEALKPGATSGDVDKACRDAVAELGLSEHFRHRTGYSIGMGFNNWIDGFSLRPAGDEEIKSSMVFHVVPFLSTPDFAVALSETVLVSPEGGERVVALPPELIVR